MKKLKRCPFCKEKPPIVRIADAIELQCQAEEKEFETLPITYAVVCDINEGGCGATSGFEESKEASAAAWNTRSSRIWREWLNRFRRTLHIIKRRIANVRRQHH